MTDISCRLAQSYIEFLDSRGPGVDEILAEVAQRLPLGESLPTRDWLLDPKKRVSWNFFSHLMDVVDERLPAGWERDFLEYDLDSDQPWLPHLKQMAGWISSPAQAYHIVNILSGPNMFGTVIVPSMEVLGPREMVLTLTIQPPHRDCAVFFRVSKIGLTLLPRFVGLNESVVQMELVERQARYAVTMPASRTLAARFVRGVKAAFSVDHFVTEMAHQEQMFRENYARLERSEYELRENRKVLEDRVQQRTLELSQANRKLAKQIEEITAAEKENRELQERLFHLQKVEAMGTLASGISHEMNNVLQGLLLSLELAARNLDPESPARSSLLTAQKFASRGGDVMKQLLGYSRKSRAERSYMEVVSTVQESVDLVRSISPSTISLRQIYPTSHKPLTILGDRTQIQQVIINLASNAIHAMRSSGGEITIEVRDLGADCQILVRDTGPGIAPEIQNQIFEPFFTTKPVGEGTGMGLSVVQAIVNSHLGRIDLNPLVAKGSEFTVTIPLAATSAVSAADPASDEVSLEGGTETILVVDDEPDLAVVIADTLEIFGYTVIRATSGKEAVDLIRSSGDQIDLVITDDSMPEMTGLELAQVLRNGPLSTLQLPVILMTGFNRSEPVEELGSGAIRNFIRKPIDAEMLNHAIRSTLDRVPPGS